MLTTGRVCDTYNTLTLILKFHLVQPLFKEIPQLADRLLLLGILATNLPLEITVPIIHEDVYWKRCYEERWPKQLPRNVTEDFIFPMYSSTSSRSETVDSSNTNHSESALQNNDLSSGIKTKTWKHYYLEMHLKEFLEYLRPEEYEPEAVCLYDYGYEHNEKIVVGKTPVEHMCSLRFRTEYITVAKLL